MYYEILLGCLYIYLAGNLSFKHEETFMTNAFVFRAMRNRGVEIYMGAVHDETFSSSHVATSSPPPGCETNDSEGEAATVGK